MLGSAWVQDIMHCRTGVIIDPLHACFGVWWWFLDFLNFLVDVAFPKF